MAYSQEWYTPPWLLEKVIRVLGEIDLDPCSNPFRTVPAKNHYIFENGQDGLENPWDVGTMFLNPPWGSIDPWVDRLVNEFTGEAILLVPDRTERPWFQRLLDLRVPLCMPKERIHYCKYEMDSTLGEEMLVEKRQMTRGSVLFYWAPGKSAEKFRDEFQDLGCLLRC